MVLQVRREDRTLESGQHSVQNRGPCDHPGGGVMRRQGGYQQIPGETLAFKGFKLPPKNDGQCECRNAWAVETVQL